MSDDDGIDLLEDNAADDDSEEATESEPLGDLAERVRQRESRTLDAAEDAFEEIDTGEVDVEDVWAELEGGPTPTGEVIEEEADVQRIEKSVCHDCPHFGDPPELHCTHEGTTIREMPDDEHFVVVECPVVAQQGGEES